MEIMHCPNCGQRNSIEQSFCRSCGMNLESTAAALTEQRAEGAIEVSDRRLELFGNIAFGGLILVGLVAVAGMIYTVFEKFILTGKGVIFGIVISLLLIFAVMGITYVVLNESQKEKRAKRTPSAGGPLPLEPVTGKLLETGDFEPIPSVVEDTTELLKVKAKTRKL